ncbi:MAG: endonuclease/exonuclease/phosphatase family protein [Flavobacteriales bacterium]
MIKKALKIVSIPVVLFALYIIGVISYATVTDYQPAPYHELKVHKNAMDLGKDTLSFMTWNIGFTGLGKETDFFYDGGSVVTQTESLVKKNRTGILDYIAKANDIDFYLLQEVDSCSKRSHYHNHLDEIQKVLPGSDYAFALNYNVDFVPVPLTDPMGKVKSGVATYSKHPLNATERIGFDSQMAWPTKLFFLDRCCIKTSTQLESDKKLFIYNTHCSAYDTAGTMVASEVDLIMSDARKEFEKGNYVVIGGDWNQCPPSYTPLGPPEAYNEFSLRNDQIDEGWKWVADETVFSNRKLNTVYEKGKSYTSVIDHYLISPNVEVLNIQGIDLNFEFSDHQPVVLKVALN